MTIINNTIYALSTILGKSGVAIVRVSGPACFKIAKAYNFEDKISHAKLFRHQLDSIVDGTMIDDCLIAYFKTPKSFTGEDVLEFHTHGSIAVIKKLLTELALFEDVRIAGPGEFSKRAFMNGKMDLSQAEGLSALIEAETEVQRQVAARQMLGEQGSLYEGWRKNLITILAQLEALIDFPTDDIPESVLGNAEKNISSILTSIKQHLSQDDRSEIIRRGVRVAIIGEPNAGKSTLLNALAKRDVAIVSETAGTTRDVIEVNLDIAGFPFIFYDTAGIRDSLDVIEQEGIRRSYRALQDSDLCLLVIDASATPTYDALMAHIVDLKKPFLVVYNKVDLLNNISESDSNDTYTSRSELICGEGANDFNPLTQYLQHNNALNSCIGYVAISLLEDTSSVENLMGHLKTYAIETYTPISEPLLTSERHRAHLREAKEYLEKFNLEYSIDIASQYVRMAANSLGHIVGKIDVEEVLDTIFSAFCIGK